jgi:hypothetical protein
MTALSTALLTDLAIPLVTTEDFLLNPAAFIGQTILFKGANGTTHLWRATELTTETIAPFNFNRGWQLLYGIRFANGAPTAQTAPYNNPYGIGEWYVNLSSDVAYIAKGATSASWIALTGGGLGS